MRHLPRRAWRVLRPGKEEEFKASDAMAFVDPAGYKSYVAEREQAFLLELAKEIR